MNFDLYTHQTISEPWQYAYCLALVPAVCMLTFGLLMDYYRRNRVNPTRLTIYLTIPWLIGGFLTMWFPKNICVGLAILLLLDALGAPWGAVLIVAIYNLVAWGISVWTAFGPQKSLETSW